MPTPTTKAQEAFSWLTGLVKAWVSTPESATHPLAPAVAGFLPWVEETVPDSSTPPPAPTSSPRPPTASTRSPNGSSTTPTPGPSRPSSKTSSSAPASPPPSTPPRRPSRPPAPSPPQSPPPDPIQHRDRVFVTGASDTGKSVIARTIFETVTGHKGIIDPTDSELTDVPGAVVFRDPLAVDLTLHLWRFVPIDPEDRDAYDALYGRVNRLPGPFFIWDDECRFSCPSSGGAPGPRTYLATKRKRQMGWVGRQHPPGRRLPGVSQPGQAHPLHDALRQRPGRARHDDVRAPGHPRRRLRRARHHGPRRLLVVAHPHPRAPALPAGRRPLPARAWTPTP